MTKHEELEERNRQLYELWKSGQSFKTISYRVGLKPARVRQICDIQRAKCKRVIENNLTVIAYCLRVLNSNKGMKKAGD